MTKLSQCARCVKDRRICGLYTPEDETDCPHYIAAQDDIISDRDDDIGCLWRTAFLIVVVFISVIVSFSGVDAPFSTVLIAVAVGLLVLAASIWLIIKGVKLLRNRIKTRKYMKEDDNMKVETVTTTTRCETSELSTRTLLQLALRKLNLQYEFDDGQNFMVRYQGETFRIIAEDDGVFIYIQDLAWYSAPLDDIDNLSLLYKAVNECNMRDMVRLVYTYNKAENELVLHTLYDILWMDRIPNEEMYLQVSFDRILGSHHRFFRMMEELRREDFARQN